MRGLISFVVVAVTVVCQLTVVNRIAFPGGSAPDLVLLVVAALALASGPLAGTLTGFLAGLALDVAPPGSHFVGQDALVFCLIGYACGLLAEDWSDDGVPELGHTALFEIVAMAAGAICGEALIALLGVMLSDPRVTWPAITSVLPVAVAYDVLFCPFVLYAAAAALRLAGARREGQRAGWAPARTAPQAGPGAGGRAGAKREPQLKLGRAGSGSGAGALAGFRAGSGAAFARGGLGGGSAKVRFGSRRHEGVLGGSRPGRARSASSARPPFRFGGSHLGRSWLGGSVFSRSSSSLGMSSPLGRSPGSLGGRAPRFSRGSGLGSRAMGRGAFRRSGKGGGWSGATAPRLRSGRSGPARLHMPRPRAKRRWRTGGYR